MANNREEVAPLQMRPAPASGPHLPIRVTRFDDDILIPDVTERGKASSKRVEASSPQPQHSSIKLDQ